MKYFIFILAIALASCHCGKHTAKERKQSFADAKQHPITLEQILKNPELYLNKTLLIEGIYMGFAGKDCIFNENTSAQITRNDWIFSTGKQCMYVTGGAPSTKKINTTIVIKATLEQNKKYYLKYIPN